MNRRNFISTLTALAGVVLAKIKAPAAPTTLSSRQFAAQFPLRDDFLAYVHVATKDGKTVPFQLNRMQRMLWDKFEADIKEGRTPKCTILKHGRFR